jgi:hypothetical protein
MRGGDVMKYGIDEEAFDVIPAEGYPRTNSLGRALCDALLDVCVMKGYVSVDENSNLKDESDIATENGSVAEALCTLAEAFNF